MQQEKKSLKQAADELDINYSTAKTIVQTFRREKRVAKKPKRGLQTKKAIKRERFMARVLTRYKVGKILAKIMESETRGEAKKPSKEKSRAHPEASTAVATQQPTELPSGMHKVFPRVTSALQMVLMPLEEEGPKEGQVSRGILTDSFELPPTKRDIFFVRSETNPEELYRDKVDYSNLVAFRAKVRPGAESKLPGLQPIAGGVGEQRHLLHPREEHPVFEFATYGPRILASRYFVPITCVPCRKTELQPSDLMERTLPVPVPNVGKGCCRK